MKERVNRNLDGKFVDTKQACLLLNLGRHTIRRLADECGAGIKVGRAYRIDSEKLIDYVQQQYRG